MNVAAYLFLANPDERAHRLARCRFSSGDVLLKWRIEPKYRWPGGPMTYEALARWLRALP